MKFILPVYLLCVLSPGLLAQASPGEANASASAGQKAASSPASQGPTIINALDMDYDEKTGTAIFTGENYGVVVNDPSFVVYCDKLTAYMRKAGATPAPGASPAKSPKPAPVKAGSAASATGSRTSGLKQAIAEGNSARPVVIVQDKAATTGTNAQSAVHNVGIAQKADYNADTGDVLLTGWPRVSQGINTQIATAPYTVMTMNRDGHTMKTRGPSRTVIEQEQPKTSGPNSRETGQSASPSPQ